MLNREINITKVRIGDIDINFFVPDPNNVEGVQSGRLDFQIINSDDSISVREGIDLLFVLNQNAIGRAHLQNLRDLRDYIRARLIAEVLPL